MNTIIETIQNHRSIRHYEDRPLTDEQIKMIVESAQAAATSSFVQAYTIIGVKDPEKKKELALLSGNTHVEKNGHLLVFCADLHRHELVAEMEEVNVQQSLDTTENFMIALIDTALAAQNAAVAAESLGLGICYIGGLRNNLDGVSKVLNIPKYVLPLFAMTIGYPSKINDKKPRLPFEHIYHEDGYQTDSSILKKQLGDYNKIIHDYYMERTNGKRSDTWTKQMALKFKEPSRTYMKEYVQKQGFNKK
ncbi:oxygen-insensitive NADPH nitroreductase [Bacillus sp. FJAT-49736]|uniref:oxygen-insensitive NADPH nitroreductase n=1 Tax=Bacillus sp. FJAT-49736 TaxID=2833582 RepID=UPI001BC9FC82|nr:oxygen-insensitive NADPH nitroreductase [Bacillus sp. FJAT-49736]MBS4172891.1 oxygen-insensitive NADPH nitroreductase [Bacillus sp. FJAT-49736]